MSEIRAKAAQVETSTPKKASRATPATPKERKSVANVTTKSTSAPKVTPAAAVAIHVSGVVRIRSPGLTPKATSDRNRAAVPLLTARAWVTPQ